MFSFPQLTILVAIAVVAVEGKLQRWHRKCAFMQSMQEPLSSLVAEHCHQTLSQNYLRNPNEESNNAGLLYIWVTGIAFGDEKTEKDETQAIAILQVVELWSKKPKVVYFGVLLQNCKKDNGKKTFTFNLAKSEVFKSKSEVGAELFAKELEKKWNSSKTARNTTGPKTNIPCNKKHAGVTDLVKMSYYAYSVSTSLNEGFRGDKKYIKLIWDSNTGKPVVHYKPASLKATWNITWGVLIPQNK